MLNIAMNLGPHHKYYTSNSNNFDPAFYLYPQRLKLSTCPAT